MAERIDIEALRAAVERMTPGPWDDDVDSIGGTVPCPNGSPRYKMVVGLERGRGWESCDSLALSDADRAGIIAIRNAIGPLLDEVAELRAELSAQTERPGCGDNAARYRRERDEAITRAEQSDMLANTAIAELALCTDEFGIVHAVDCEDDSVCDCSERLSWLTSDMVSKARAAIRARRGGQL